MKKVINAAICDARAVTEESLAACEHITINAATLLVDERSKALLNQYPVEMNVANVLSVPEGLSVKSMNGKAEIGPDAEGEGIFLIVNGKLTIKNDSLEAAKSYGGIVVNGKVLMPKSYQGKLSNLQVNGNTDDYPDGAEILKADTAIDDLFVLRARNTRYYAPGTLLFLDTGINTGTLLEKGLEFSAQKIVIAESLVHTLAACFDEESEIIRVPDGTGYIDDDVELKPRIVKKYGTKLYVDGDVTILEYEALEGLTYLYVGGVVSVAKNLAEDFDQIESVYDDLKIVDPKLHRIKDQNSVKIGKKLLAMYPGGVLIKDCNQVILSEDLSPEEIVKQLKIEDCVHVVCTKEQEEAVSLIAEDIAGIELAEDGQASKDEGDSFFGRAKDTQVINAAEYKM